MSAEKPLLVILGATGTQGGSVISHFLSLFPSPYTLRGITRNPTSPNSISLASLGVEVVAGDFDDPASLDTAFKGASVIFSVTDFWKSYANPSLHKLSGGKYSHVYHFDGKAIAEEYGKSTYPELWEKTSVFYAGYYLENYFSPAGGLFRPRLDKEKDNLILAVPEPLGTTPLPMYSAIDDTGTIVHALLRTSPGKKLIGVNEWLSFREFARILAQVLGKHIEFVEIDFSFDLGDPEINKDHDEMGGFCVEFGYDGGKVDKGIIQPTSLGVPLQLHTVKEWCLKQDWKLVLDINK
ncbi:hypothetical protein N0V90_000192 [Kalmusia sp. IMI 367209]|nr:hypothetical protein N0V90_000192 [Kalmusia sp. IMI 367209]